MTSVRFQFYHSTSKRNQEGKLFIRVIHNRKSKNIRTDYRIFSEEWDTAEKKIIYYKESCERNEYLLRLQEKMEQDIERLHQFIRELSSLNKDYEIEDIVDGFSINVSPDTLNGYCQLLCENLQDNGQIRTARAYRSAVKRFLEFTKDPKMSLKKINRNQIKEYEKYLLDNGLQMNTISFYMRNLRAIYNKAFEEGVVRHYQQKLFGKVFTGVYETRRRSLAKNDMVILQKMLQQLENRITLLSSEKPISPRFSSELKRNIFLKEGLFYFLFSYHARGMSFVDLAYLQKNSIKNNTIRYKRKKTGGYFEIKVTTPMKQIIRYFKDKNPDSKYLFPIIKESKGNERLQYENGLRRQNLCLRILAQKAGLNKALTTHVARHTYATLAKRANIPLMIISEALGHKDTQTTHKYLDSFERSKLDELSIFMSRMINENCGD